MASSVYEASKELVVFEGCLLEQYTRGSAVEPTEEPVVELELGGAVYGFSNWSEVLWLHRVNPRRTQSTGLALLCCKISDFVLSASLWASWVLLSLGKLIRHLCLRQRV